MAPDLNGLSSKTRETWDYTTPGSTGYNISNHVYNDPSTRKLKVLTVGAGLSSIMMAYQIEKECQNVENVIYEKNADIGGTWLENRYPGCACDVPSHAYTFTWALNPDWPQFFSRSPDIWEYLNKICEVFNLRRYMTFNTEVIAMDWQEDLGQWKVTLKQQQPDQEPRIFEEHCDVLLYATGLLNHFKWPKIPGLEKFKGRKVHTAQWPADYDDSKWKDDRVAIIGSGASSVQTLPNMQPFAKHIDVFVRTGVWFVQIANNYGQNHEYTTEEKEKFRTEPDALVAHAKSIENQINAGWDMFYSDSEAQRMAQDIFKQRMREFIKDDRLLEGFTPKFEVGCRRITPGDPYMKAIQEPNVDVHFTTVTSITETGVVGQDGIERKVDTIVCATGFDVTYRPRFPVRGRNGVDLAEKWRDAPEGYLGLAVPDMPNFLMFIGPTWPVENGSVTGPLQQVGKYAVDYIKKMQREHIKSMCPRQDITDAFNAHAQEWYTHTVWRDSCRAWYKNNDTNRINAIWPGSSLHYIEVLKNPRWEDYDIRYVHSNPFAALGMGYSLLDSDPNKQEKDLSPYIQRENIDPRWLKAVGYEGKL